MNDNSINVSICMSSYNGEEFIEKQIYSILNQTYSDFKLYIRDDGSTDNTKLIIDDFVKKDNRVIVYSDECGNLKPARSFIEMLLNIDSDIYMFADQDDVWNPDKINNAVEFLKSRLDDVVLYCTDLNVVDQDLNMIHSSFMTREGYNPLKQKKLSKLVFQNFVVGCTVAFTRNTNSILRQYYTPESKFVMHDWLLAMIASAYGYIHFEAKPSLMYRQHQNNSVGSPGTGFNKYLKVFLSEGLLNKTSRYLKLISQQFSAFENAFINNKPVDDFPEFKLIAAFMHAPTAIGFLKVLKLGAGMNGLIRNLALFLVCMLGVK